MKDKYHDGCTENNELQEITFANVFLSSVVQSPKALM